MLTLLATKTHIPPLTGQPLERPRLTARLDEALAPGCRLALLSAPAGYGKSTLLAGWARAAAQRGVKIGWLSLDAADSDPGTFLTYLAAALEPALPGAAEAAAVTLSMPGAAPAAAVLAPLLNRMAGLGQPLALVLDDYQQVSGPGAHEALAFLLEHLPEQAHLYLATRADPPLPVHRLRARGQLVELRAADLRFSREEVRRFFEQPAGEQLSPGDLELLEQRTEGWAAGLRMALISMQGRGGAAGLLRSLSGTQRYILDYLTEEALASQTPEVQRFLLETAQLERFSAALCAALLPDLPAGDILRELERANLFLIPLDDEREWFRYHHLFADLLQARFAQAREPGEDAGFYARAARWFLARELLGEALSYAGAAGDFELAADIIEQHTPRLLAQGQLNRLLALIARLPPELSARRLWLNVGLAWALAFRGQLAEVEKPLARIEAVMDGLPAGQRERLEVEILGVRCLAAVSAGRMEAAAQLCDVPLDSLPAGSDFAASSLRWTRGYVARSRGRMAQAEVEFSEMLRLGERMDNLLTVITACSELGVTRRECGRLAEAEQVLRRGLEQVERRSGALHAYLGRLESFLAAVLYDQDRLPEARELLERSDEHNRLWPNPNHVAYSNALWVQLLLAEGGLAAARSRLEQAEQVIADNPVVPAVRALITRGRAALEVAGGQAHVALARAREALGASGRAPQELLSAAWVLAQVGQGQAARPALERLAQESRATGRTGMLVEALLYLGLAGEEAALREALALGEEGGLRRVFLDAGQGLRDGLIRIAKELRRGMPGGALLGELLARVGEAPPAEAGADGPLTGREREVLAAMAAGLSNAEIGRQLYISLGTVKAHTAAIYRKLDAANRAEAVARAKDLGLIG